MGRMLGSFADNNELDRPDLNKCPDCNCFFAGDTCPLCGKVCPEEMRAGNRKPVKQKKVKNTGSGRVTFVEWYHSWWFIVIMMFIFPLVGIVLLATSPHSRSKKITFCIIAAVYMIVSYIGIGSIIGGIKDLFYKPVDPDMTKQDYEAVCEQISAEQLYRSPEGYDFVSLTLRVRSKADIYEAGKDYTYYACESLEGQECFIIIRDCLLDGKKNFMVGDIITVWGVSADEEIHVYANDGYYTEYSGPCVNMAYVDVEG